MPIERATHPYEILLRLGPEGFVAGHVKDLEFLVEDGEKIAGSDKESLPRPITREEAGAIIGKKNAELIERFEAEKKRADETKATLKAVIAEAADAMEVVAAERDAAVAKLAQARDALAEDR